MAAETNLYRFEPSDRRLMQMALRLAERGLGNVWPNPAVGCVVVHHGRIVGRGWTQPGGRPHAEAEALARSGAAAQGATAYVTLEPCCHWGKTPPCSDALIAAGIGRIVIAAEDPDPRVAGGGIAQLRQAGIEVAAGLCAAEAVELNAGFFARVQCRRPLVTLKLATTLDGRIATQTGESRWITGAAAREAAHRLRATHDAVLVGTGTVLADDPQLTCRLPGLEHRSPVRIALDRTLRIAMEAHIIAAARQVPTWIVTLPDADPVRRDQRRAAGVEIVEVAGDPVGQIDIAAALRALGERGLTRLLVEGGGRLAAALLRAGLVDRLAWLHAPLVLGGDAMPAVAALGIDRLATAPRFERIDVQPLGDDVLSLYRRRS
jgi:diaminohydroxyphosphoribosylaminopyrimidine deaminase / 5-amino-6-(5-phosphoribosylamino)uracil reductase